MKLPLRLTDLLLVFAGLDALLAGLALQAAGHPILVALEIATVVGLCMAYREREHSRAGQMIMSALVLTTFILPQVVLLLVRDPHAPIQDSLLLTEAAAGRLLSGQNPYGHDYISDPAVRSFYLPEIPVNPLLGHFVYTPGMILLAALWRIVAPGLGAGWLWPLGQTALTASAWSLSRFGLGRAAVIAVALCPVLLLDQLNLFNDVFFIAAGIGAVGAAGAGRRIAAGTMLGASLLLKQEAVVFVPFVALLAWRAGRMAGAVRVAAVSAAVLMAGVLPFLAWDARAFAADVAGYFYSSGTGSFPIRGPGLPGLLTAVGVIPSRWSAYPAALIQGLVALPVLGIGLLRLARRFSWPGLWAWTGLWTLALFLTGRTLAPNYLDLCIALFALGLASHLAEVDPGGEAPRAGVKPPARDQGVVPSGA